MISMFKTHFKELDDSQVLLLTAYWEMLLDWNTRINLTSVTDTATALQKHFDDSLHATRFIHQDAHCIDVGTGAGFPGIPLLIARPDIRMTLLDGLHKRVVFLETVCKELGLPAVCVHARAEDAGHNAAHREKYDVALSRAVAPLPVLLEFMVPFLRIGGLAIAYKGNVEEELAVSSHALGILHCHAAVAKLDTDYGARTLVLVEKRAKTADTYPRRAGLPKREPL